MNRSILAVTLLIMLSWINPSFSQLSINVMKGDGSYWQCSAYDGADNQWLAKSPYKQVAINKSFDACKKESKTPGSCKTANEHCESFIKGVSTRPMWRCTGFDYLAQAWVGDIYRTRDAAAIGAKAYCAERTGISDACYVNLLTCRNLNLLR